MGGRDKLDKFELYSAEVKLIKNFVLGCGYDKYLHANV